jgi:hypothetical protein
MNGLMSHIVECDEPPRMQAGHYYPDSGARTRSGVKKFEAGYSISFTAFQT